MRILIIGATGMLGHSLARNWFESQSLSVTSRFTVEKTLKLLKIPAESLDVYPGVEVNDIEKIENVLLQVRPHFVVNCVGIVKQAPESEDPILSIQVNSLFPHMLHAICEKNSIKLIHISTDCVFSGKLNRPYTEEDNPDPVDVYGRSKLLGEIHTGSGLTLRTSIIGLELLRRHGLLEWFLTRTNLTAQGYQNALFTGFTTRELSKIILMVITEHAQLSGLWHVSSNPISKYELLGLINQTLDLGVEIQPNDEFLCDRRLCSDKFRIETGYAPPEWRDMIGEVKNDIKKRIITYVNRS